jgi:DNA-binding sugar fermentation-stimulating protein
MTTTQRMEKNQPIKHNIFCYNKPLVKGIITKRPSKYCKTPYVADVLYNEKQKCTLAHTPALGCCGLTDKDASVYMIEKENKKTCHFSVELSILSNKLLVGCNPKMSENLVELILKSNLFEPLINYKEYCREKKRLNSRFDFSGMDQNNTEFIMEVKTVPLAKYEEKYNCLVSYFPDGYRKSKKEVVSPRALKHVQELEQLKLEKKDKIRCILCFVIQRNDSVYFRPSNGDLVYKKALKQAYDNGVEIIPIAFEWDSDGNCYYVNKSLPILWT